ncbi:MAG: hypothetical protein R3B53_01885 [Candidatus Paceibacterota bacterium]
MNSLLAQKKISTLLTGAFGLLIVLALNTNLALAQANPQINYQGKLTNGSGVAVPDGTYNMRFWILTSPSIATSSALWTESLTASDTKVQVTNGLFSVMLGSSTPLTSVDWNQTLYLGVEIGGTSTPAWDGEMSPRKILGTVPAAFVANYANVAGSASTSDSATTAVSASSSDTLAGIASSSFLRSDEADTMEATSTSPLLSLIQNGTGKLLSLFRGLTEVFTVGNNGHVGVGTSTPGSLFSVQGTAGSSTPLFTVASSTGTALMGILSNGNVGIGTNSAGEKLEVVGNIISKGTEWTLRTSTTTNSWHSVTYGNGLFVAVAFTGGVMTSPDGINWTPRTAAAANQWTSITYGNGIFVAVSNNGTDRVMTSPDGINWTSRKSITSNRLWSAVTYGNGLFVAVETGAAGSDQVMTSPDGITWTNRSATGAAWSSIAYGNGLFVAVSSDGSGTMTSVDGIVWNYPSSPTSNAWSAITYGNGLFVTVASTGSGDRVMISPDGVTWATSTSVADNSWHSVTYGNGLFVAVSNDGSGNRVMTSPDGITWKTRSTSGIDKSYLGVTYGSGIFVAVASTGSGQDVMTSGKVDYSVLAHNNIYQGGMSVFGNLRSVHLPIVILSR